VRRHMIVSMLGCAVLLFAGGCSFFIGPESDAPGQTQHATQNSQLRSEIDALQRRFDLEQASRKLPDDARLWVRITFDSGVATVSEQTHEVLHDLMAKYRALQALEAKRRGGRPHQRFLFVQGFCDNEPIGGYDGSHVPSAHHYKSLLALSEARAVNVAEILMQSGIPHEHVAIQPFGASHFVARNNSERERRQNRRVDVFIVDR